MPYITKENRRRVEPEWRDRFPAEGVGELNYQITRLCDDFIQRAPKGLSYSSINAVIGVLECAKLELYRRVAAPYEDTKRHENGEVYSCIKPEGQFNG